MTIDFINPTGDKIILNRDDPVPIVPARVCAMDTREYSLQKARDSVFLHKHILSTPKYQYHRFVRNIRPGKNYYSHIEITTVCKCVICKMRIEQKVRANENTLIGGIPAKILLKHENERINKKNRTFCPVCKRYTSGISFNVEDEHTIYKCKKCDTYHI